MLNLQKKITILIELFFYIKLYNNLIEFIFEFDFYLFINFFDKQKDFKYKSDTPLDLGYKLI